MDPNPSKTQTGFAITMFQQRTVLCMYPSSWWPTQWWWSSPLPPPPPTGRMIYILIDWVILDQWIHSAEQYSKKSSLHLGASQQFAVFFLYWTQIEQGRGFAGHNMFHKLAHRWKHLCSFYSRPHGTILSLAGLADDNWRHLPIPL